MNHILRFVGAVFLLLSIDIYCDREERPVRRNMLTGIKIPPKTLIENMDRSFSSIALKFDPNMMDKFLPYMEVLHQHASAEALLESLAEGIDRKMWNYRLILPPQARRLDENVFRIKSLKLERLGGISHLPELFLEGFTRVRYFSLSNAQIESMDPGAFDSLFRVERMSVEHTHLKSLNGVFEQLSHLVYLSLQHNRIEKIDYDTFTGLDSLEVLHLSRNAIISVEPSAFSPLWKCKKLDLTHNYLKELQPSSLMSGLKNIETILLNDNELTSISSTFTEVPSLRELFLSQNRINKLSGDDLNGLTNLRHIYLSRNEIAAIEANTFAYVPQLLYLSLENNKITNIDINAFTEHSQLEHLILKNNKLRELNGLVFQHLFELQSLDLSFNQIGPLHRDIFKKNVKMKHLDVSGVGHDTIMKSSIDRLHHLESLNVSRIDHTHISFLETVTVMPNLKKLILRNNHIQSIPDNFCSLWSNLRELDFSYNNLQMSEPFDYSRFAFCSNLVKLDMYNENVSEIVVNLQSPVAYNGSITIGKEHRIKFVWRGKSGLLTSC